MMIIPGYYLLNLKSSFNISFFFLCTFFFFASEFFLFKGHICLLPCSVLIYFSNLSRYGVSSKIYLRSHRHHPSSHRIAHASACIASHHHDAIYPKTKFDFIIYFQDFSYFIAPLIYCQLVLVVH